MLLSTVATQFYIPTNSVEAFQLLHILPNTCYFILFYFTVSILMSVMNDFQNVTDVGNQEPPPAYPTSSLPDISATHWCSRLQL